MSEDGAVATVGVPDAWRAAASTAVMMSGRHFAQFTKLAGNNMKFGVVGSDWDVEGGMNSYNIDGHCFYQTFDGRRFPGSTDCEGQQPARQHGDRIGMLLDLDQGSMTAWKHDG